jgi:hypothetical protein
MNKYLSSISPAVVLLIAEMGLAAFFIQRYFTTITSNVLNAVLVGSFIMVTLVFWLTIFQFNNSWVNRGLYYIITRTSEPSFEEEEIIYEEIRNEPEGEVELLTIAYGTKKTVTTESAKRIASLLENKFGLEIDIVDLQHNPSLNKQYNNIIIGSSVEIGKWTTHTAVVKFLENNKYARIY